VVERKKEKKQLHQDLGGRKGKKSTTMEKADHRKPHRGGHRDYRGGKSDEGKEKSPRPSRRKGHHSVPHWPPRGKESKIPPRETNHYL